MKMPVKKNWPKIHCREKIVIHKSTNSVSPFTFFGLNQDERLLVNLLF